MKTTQTELWLRATSECSDLGVEDKCKTPRHEELEKLYYELCGQFSDVLVGHWKDIFRHIQDIMEDVGFCRQEQGVAMGLCIAKEMRDFIENPDAAYRAASENYAPIKKMEGRNISGIEAALKGIGGTGA